MLVLKPCQKRNAGRQDDIQAELEQTEAEMLSAALQLSRQRQAAVQPLKAAVEACLADLAMPASRFDIDLGWQDGHEVCTSSSKIELT